MSAEPPVPSAEQRVPSTEARVPRWAAGVCEGVSAAGIRDVVYVPDNPLSHVLREFRERFADVRLLPGQFRQRPAVLEL